MTGTINPIEILKSVGELKDLIYLVPIIVLGVLYYIFDLRGFFLRPSLGAIHCNLQDRILAPFAADPAITGSEDYLRTKRIILDIFYFFIDNDESLKERAKNVYLNGLIWSSVTDIIAVSALSAPIYGIAFLITDKMDHIMLAAVFLSLLLLSGFCLQPLAQRQHINLQNEQIDYILLHKRNELKQKLVDAAHQ